GLQFSSPAVPAVGSELSVDDKVVARITSACYCPACESPIALAYVQRGHDRQGETFTLSAGTATVYTLPFENL
ncbi:MAG: glycine cleavage T C-terminal barrel domain-containing protein, partial [Pirellulaceae bacterium]